MRLRSGRQHKAWGERSEPQESNEKNYEPAERAAAQARESVARFAGSEFVGCDPGVTLAPLAHPGLYAVAYYAGSARAVRTHGR